MSTIKRMIDSHQDRPVMNMITHVRELVIRWQKKSCLAKAGFSNELNALIEKLLFHNLPIFHFI